LLDYAGQPKALKFSYLKRGPKKSQQKYITFRYIFMEPVQ
jgi:hypothetical protein